jgi:protein required for attachment to host cells
MQHIEAMRHLWVTVCDAAKARLFELRSGDPSWHVVELVLHAESRTKSSDLVGDRSGSRSSEGASVHHNALAPGSSPKDNEKEHFAHSLATTLDQAMRAGRFGKWILVAPPHFLGLMRKELTGELEKHLVATVDKDLNDLDVHALAERLRDVTQNAMNDSAGAREDHRQRR